jgi:cytidylate kinase
MTAPKTADRFTVAVDGPAAAGKGTICRALAAHFGLAYLDTGLLYRAVGNKTLGGLDPSEAARDLTDADLEAPGLRSARVAEAASQVASLPPVRAALLEFQRAFAIRPGGAILDGRDIGTVICPGANAKLFITASPEVRAKRRLQELIAGGETTSFETVLADVKARDARDSARAAAPMIAADDAVVIDTSDLSIETAIAKAIETVAARRPPSSGP